MLSGFWARLTKGADRVSEDVRLKSGPLTRDVLEGLLNQVPSSRVRFKPGRTIARAVLQTEAGSVPVYLKIQQRHPLWCRLACLLRPDSNGSAASLEFRNLESVRRSGIPVPVVLCRAHFIGPGLQLRSVLVTRELSGMFPLHEAVVAASRALSGPGFRCWKRQTAVELARLCRLLHEARRCHKDLYLCHFFVPGSAISERAGLRGRIHLIDLLRLAHHPWRWRRWQVKDLAQLLYSSDIPEISDRDRLRFFLSYCRTEKLRGRQRRRLLDSVLSKAGRYRRYNEKKRVATAPGTAAPEHSPGLGKSHRRLRGPRP